MMKRVRTYISKPEKKVDKPKWTLQKEGEGKSLKYEFRGSECGT